MDEEKKEISNFLKRRFEQILLNEPPRSILFEKFNIIISYEEDNKLFDFYSSVLTKRLDFSGSDLSPAVKDPIRWIQSFGYIVDDRNGRFFFNKSFVAFRGDLVDKIDKGLSTGYSLSVQKYYHFDVSPSNFIFDWISRDPEFGMNLFNIVEKKTGFSLSKMLSFYYNNNYKEY